jgi:16S rRNA (uracil1498-N3)-methyltransferase
MQNFFLHHAHRHDDTVSVYGEDFHYLKNVRRTGEGDRFTAVLRGDVYLLEVSSVLRDQIVCTVLEKRSARAMILRRIIVYQALLKSAKMDLVVSRLGELGVEALHPVWTERSVVRGNPGEGRYNRWEKLSREAAKISGVERSMRVAPPVHLNQIPGQCRAEGGPGLVFCAPSAPDPGTPEPVGIFQLLEKLSPAEREPLHLVFGPEGGFSAGEIHALTREGMEPVSLCSLTLRSETAALLGTGVIRLYTERES